MFASRARVNTCVGADGRPVRVSVLSSRLDSFFFSLLRLLFFLSSSAPPKKRNETEPARAQKKKKKRHVLQAAEITMNAGEHVENLRETVQQVNEGAQARLTLTPPLNEIGL